MQFLLEAIRRNATKIGLTMLLCLVVLYVFATVTYMVFRDMYGFNVSTAGDRVMYAATHSVAVPTLASARHRHPCQSLLVDSHDSGPVLCHFQIRDSLATQKTDLLLDQLLRLRWCDFRVSATATA